MKRMLLSIAALTMLFGATLLTSCTKDDVTAPVITLLGDASVDVVLGTTYTDAGATADDATDGDLTSSIVVDNAVNANIAGTYYVTYTVSDAAGNTATKKRTVNVKNSLSNYTGSYAATDDYNSDGTVDYTWTETITASSTVNNELVFSKFANYTGCNLKVDVSGSSITGSLQTIMCGAAGSQQNRTFSALSGSITATVISVNYHEVDADTFTTDGVDTFTKQ
jgi:hypothetical protein